MHGFKNVFVGMAFAATLVSSVAAASCTATAESSTTDSWITVKQDGDEIGRSESMQCVNSDDPNMIDAGLDHKVAVFASCATKVDACWVSYGDQKNIKGTVDSGTGWASCEAEFDCP